MRIAIIGASSFIGWHIFQTFRNQDFVSSVIGTCFKCNKSDELVRLDITNQKEVGNFLKEHLPDFVLMIAGNKNVSECEKKSEFARQINVEPVQFLINSIKEYSLKTKIIFTSSDYVFDGSTGNYEDSDSPKPKTVYGDNKLEAEELLKESGLSYKVIRTSAVIGAGSVLLEWLKGELVKDVEISLFSNVYFSPTPISLLLEMFQKIIENYDEIDSSILHVVGEKRLNRYDFAKLCSELIYNSKAHLTSEEINLEDTLFQHDLSLVASDFVIKNKELEFNDYLKKALYD